MRIEDVLLLSTKTPDVVNWNNRMAALMQSFGFPIGRIDWNGSPSIVSARCISFAKQYQGNHLKSLLDYLTNVHETIKLGIPID